MNYAVMPPSETTSPESNDYFEQTRDAVQARLRNVVREVLRKYGYPQTLREQVVEQVLALAKLTDGGDGQ